MRKTTAPNAGVAMKYAVVLAAIVPACQLNEPDATLSQAVTTYSSPRDFGAIPDDGIDERTALQAVFTACAGATVSLEAGPHEVVTPSPRSVAMLTLPAGTPLQGLGQ